MISTFENSIPATDTLPRHPASFFAWRLTWKDSSGRCIIHEGASGTRPPFSHQLRERWLSPPQMRLSIAEHIPPRGADWLLLARSSSQIHAPCNGEVASFSGFQLGASSRSRLHQTEVFTVFPARHPPCELSCAHGTCSVGRRQALWRACTPFY